MTKILGHFDGKVVVPSDAGKLRANQTVTIMGEPSDPEFGTAQFVASRMALNPISDDDAEQMRQAIEEDCERIEPDPDINLD